MLRRIAQTLAAIGVREALVVHGSGLDEVALHGETRAIRLSNGEMHELEITPEDAGFERAPLSVVTGGGPEENAARLRTILAGEGERAENDIIALNAGALLMTAGKADDLARGRGDGARRACSRQGRARCSTLISRPAMADVLARIVARKRREVAARLAGPVAGRSRPRAACAPRWPAPARASSWRSSAPRRRATAARSSVEAAVAAYAPVADAISVLTDGARFRRLARRPGDGPRSASTGRSWPRISSSTRPRSAKRAAHGADAVLAMMSVLDDATRRGGAGRGAAAGMDAIVEVHDEAELARALRAWRDASSASTIATSRR